MHRFCLARGLQRVSCCPSCQLRIGVSIDAGMLHSLCLISELGHYSSPNKKRSLVSRSWIFGSRNRDSLAMPTFNSLVSRIHNVLRGHLRRGEERRRVVLLARVASARNSALIVDNIFQQAMAGTLKYQPL